jgi:DNA uptake protein ComE-like DNA-binding protein
MKRMKVMACAAMIVILLALGLAHPAASQVGKNQGVVYPNLAAEKDLLALPHLNAALVKGILDKRPFLSMTELHAFLSQSLSKEQLTELYAKMFIPINLNTATREEILLVPGVGNRMLREFLEYRPYKAMAQFRKEIGKYVNAAELARLEQYVFVPVNLNTASDEDLLSIPGVGQRMLREFKEYRPYQNIERFRKEIGKYVNAKEVARLERYITLN